MVGLSVKDDVNVIHEIILRYIDGCPNWQVAEARLERAMERLGHRTEIRLVRVETPQDARALGFRGSPTILVDGRDPFDASGHAGLSCRVYRTDSGLEGAPSVDQLVKALNEARRRSRASTR